MGCVTVKFVKPTPAMPSHDVALAVEFYGEVLGFETVHAEDGFALRRDGTTIRSGQPTRLARELDPDEPSVRASRSAGTRALRAGRGRRRLYACNGAASCIPTPLGDRPWGTREFGIVDPDGNLVTFWQRP